MEASEQASLSRSEEQSLNQDVLHDGLQAPSTSSPALRSSFLAFNLPGTE